MVDKNVVNEKLNEGWAKQEIAEAYKWSLEDIECAVRELNSEHMRVRNRWAKIIFLPLGLAGCVWLFYQIF